MILRRSVAVIESTCRNYAYLAAADVSFPVGFQSFTAAACGLYIDFAALDGHDGVTLDTCRSLGLQLFRVPLAITRADDCGTSAIDGDVVVAIDALGTLACRLYIDDTTVDDGIRTLDAVVGSIHIEVHAFFNDNIALAVDTVIIGRVDVERTSTADDEFALAVECALVVLSGAIGQLVAARKHEIGSCFALNVNGGTLCAGDVGSVQLQHEVCLAVDV